MNNIYFSIVLTVLSIISALLIYKKTRKFNHIYVSVFFILILSINFYISSKIWDRVKLDDDVYWVDSYWTTKYFEDNYNILINSDSKKNIYWDWQLYLSWYHILANLWLIFILLLIRWGLYFRKSKRED
jgi:uncharacterized membrane protein